MQRKLFTPRIRFADPSLFSPGSAKAVSDGAVIWHCTNFVTARRTRLSYGIEISDEYSIRNPQHRDRRIFTRADGARVIDGVWSTLIEKVIGGA